MQPAFVGIGVPDSGFAGIDAVQEVQVHEGEEGERDTLKDQTNEEDLNILLLV